MQTVDHSLAQDPYTEHIVTESLTPLARRRSFARWLVTIFCLLPAICLFGLFVIFPVVQAVYTSLFNWSGLGPLQEFIGLKNYVQLLKDVVFVNAVKTNLTIVLLSLVFQIPSSLFLALLVRQRRPGI